MESEPDIGPMGYEYVGYQRNAPEISGQANLEKDSRRQDGFEIERNIIRLGVARPLLRTYRRFTVLIWFHMSI